MAIVAAIYPDAGGSVAAGSTIPVGTPPNDPGHDAVVTSGTGANNATVGPSPSTSATASTGRQTTAPASAKTVTGVYTTGVVWTTLFEGRVLLKNSTSSARSWQVTLTFPDGVGAERTHWVDGASAPKMSRSGQVITYQSTMKIPAGGEIALHFQLEKTGNSLSDFEPSACVVNGSSCR